jgi:poly(hydroxyalkanoate) depolymerase family esterase
MKAPMNHTLQALMQEATRLTGSGQLLEATKTIQRALRGEETHPANLVEGPEVLDGLVTEVSGRAASNAASPGGFSSGSHTHRALTRDYKLFVPPGHTRPARALVVMLHGCTQHPDDFAAGTAMNERAREQGFLVLYPAQAADANPQRCWNWFKHNHQQRDRGEPALIASLTRQVAQTQGVDARRVYVAGLSAGGAMAAIVAAAYPEIYAAVGVHSGLPVGAAANLPEAMAAMQGGASAAPVPHAVPTIVFHGDQDRTVHPRNGEQLVAAVARGGAPRVEQGTTARGRRYTRSIHTGAPGAAAAEHWLVHGAGHAWSGGQPAGSYTDAHGPDATREMLRFFFEHPAR